MSAQQLSSIISGFSQYDIKLIEQLLNARQQHQQSYLSESSDTDSNVSLVDDYSSDNESSPVLKKKAGKPRGRPTKVRTDEEVATMKAKIDAKEQRRIEREIKNAMKSDEVVAKQYRNQRRTEDALSKKALVAQKAIDMKRKRTEIYDQMLTAASDYKTKWNL
jgi:hypothetical protein